MKREFEEIMQEPLFIEGRKCRNLAELTAYVIRELQKLEANLYLRNLDEYDCLICGSIYLVLDETRGEQICKSCGTARREKLIEEEITNYRKEVEVDE
ncbi:MAG: hypothetical protein KAU62_10475 [Candidatus Heimdallarchaeota archaeon]|nr:hypothetical protein [Candidatus Heimdallarchaeota archaeon]MCK4611569.1 hypothetical protein [Candidatus Heimdallarchaeota archaeon]